MALTVYNTLTRQKERFQPLFKPDSNQGSQPEDPSQLGPWVNMYVCGVTVYDYCHLGHARTYIVWDTVRRFLQWSGYQVLYVQNFTDVDDKILKRAADAGLSMAELSQRYIETYFEDMDRLNILRADCYPRATESLAAIIEFIQSLELKGFAYRVQHHHEDVYYSVRSFADYGRLSGRSLNDMQAGASGRVGEDGVVKQDPFDFALWKSAPVDEPGFDSPWGWGRPGWHIECSAMARATIGDHVDIHAGGADLIFPHHENEIAQSEPITGKPFAKYWLHNGFLNINGEKMSKSLGNFTTLRDALAVWDPMALRLFFLQTHYRSPIDLTDESLKAAANGWATLSKGILAAQAFLAEGQTNGPDPDAMAHFRTAMEDDFGTPGALAVAFELARDLSREENVLKHQGQVDMDPIQLQQKSQALTEITTTLGLVATPAERGAGDTGPSDAEIEALIVQRKTAKKAKNFAEADRIRDELKVQGIALVDQPGGMTRWIRE